MNPPVKQTILCWLLGVLCAGSTAKTAVVRPPEESYLPLKERLRTGSRVKPGRLTA